MANDIVLQLNPGPGNRRNSEATFVTLDSGRLLLAWSKFIGDDHSDFGAGVIASRYSDDGGRTWNDNDRILIKKDAKATNVMSPSLLRLRDGRIMLLFLRKEGHGVCQPWVCFADGAARKFSKPECIMPAHRYFIVNNDRVIQLKSGRIIMPVCEARWRLPWEPKEPRKRLPGDTKTIYTKAHEPFMAEPCLIFYYFSDDGGQTWMESRQSWLYCAEDGTGSEEPGVVELKNGTLWSWARTGRINEISSPQWQSFSRDKGQTWSTPGPSRFISPCSPMSVKRIPKTGHLVALWNDHSKRFKVPKAKPISWARTPLESAISADEGKTWNRHKLIEGASDHGFCYVAIHFTDEALLLSYNAGGAGTRNPLDTQRVRRITFDELYRT